MSALHLITKPNVMSALHLITKPNVMCARPYGKKKMKN